VLAALIAMACPPLQATDLTSIPMTAQRWQAEGDVTFGHDPDGGTVLAVNKGYAELKGTDFSNGTIEFDAKFVGRRITGITFRHHGDSADALYVRPSPECPVSDDCIQYMPTAYHVFEWDLYGQYQARAPIKPEGWNHIRMVVSGGRMDVFVNGMRSPTLAVDTLLGGSPDGAIRLHGPASYAHMKIDARQTGGLSADAPGSSTALDPRYIIHWLASTPFVMPARMDAALGENTGVDPTYSSVPTESATWSPVTPDPNGLINLTRWYGAAQTGNAIAGIWLKTTVTSDREQIKHVDLGWTREVWIFVNGKRVFADKNLYGVEGATKQPGGRLALTNGSFDLPLHQGANAIVVALDDNFGGGEQHFGWGLQMRMADLDGIDTAGGRDVRQGVPGAN
jgi:hypothetical protein